MKVCPNCGLIFDDDKIFCSHCGAKLVEKIKINDKNNNVFAVKSEIKGANGDVFAYKSRVEGRVGDNPAEVGHQEVIANRSKVAGGHIVEGDYVNQNIYINVIGGIQEKKDKFYLVYLDEKGEERFLELENKIEIYRKENSWEVVAWDGKQELSMNLRDMGVSRKNKRIRIWINNGKVYVYDYGMRSGLYVNGRRMRGEVEISPGDMISVSTLVIRLEKDPESISVKNNSLTFIPEYIAKMLPRELVYFSNGRYYLNAFGLKDGTRMKVGNKTIQVEKTKDINESISINKKFLESVEGEVFSDMVKKMSMSIPNEVMGKINTLLDLYVEADGIERKLIKKKIFRLLEGVR